MVRVHSRALPALACLGLALLLVVADQQPLGAEEQVVITPRLSNWTTSCELKMERQESCVGGRPWWTRAMLNQAHAHANYAQFLPLFQKLTAGQPIAVSFFGSSVTDNGGFFHKSEAFLASKVQAVPGTYMSGRCVRARAWPRWREEED